MGIRATFCPLQVRIKGEDISQQCVKIEMLEKRLENARKDGESFVTYAVTHAVTYAVTNSVTMVEVI